MSLAKPSRRIAAAKLLPAAIAALALAGCGGSFTNPPAGSANVTQGRGRVDDPRTNDPNHVACLRNAGVPVTLVTVHGTPGLVLGSTPGSPTVAFEPTDGVAQGLQISGVNWAQGAEVIGAALLFDNQGSDALLKKIETCLAVGVSG